MPSSDAVRVLFGRVVDEKTHRPLGGATVEIAGTSGLAGATDDLGLFVLPVTDAASSLDLRVTYGGIEVARKTALTAAPLLLTVPASTSSRPTERAVAETPTLSSAKQYWLTRLIADARIARAAGRATTVPPGLLGGDECQCDTCLSAVSPVAYLADLIAYLVSSVTNGGAAISLSWLQDAFCQQFGELLLDCEDVDRQVHQVRICIEVLRCSLDVAQPVPGEDVYRLHAYRELLQRQGTNVDEIRLAPHLDDDARSLLAQRLGIVTGQRPDRLDALALSSTALTEGALETLFGLADTTRNPLSDGVTRNDAAHLIRRWNVEHVRWGRNTDRDGIGYVGISYDGKYGTFSLYRDAARTQLVASGTSSANVVGLSPQNGGLLTGRVELQSWSPTTTIELQLIPKLVAWRLDQLRQLWADADRPPNVFVDFAADLPSSARRPIIDADLIGVDDFRYPYLPATGAPDNAFDIWSRRRLFVDAQLHELALMTKTVPSPGGTVTVPDFNLLLASNFKPVQYETRPAVDVWKAPLTVADLDRTARELGRPDTAAAAADRVTNGFLLSLPAFARLMELRQRDRQGDILAADEWDEVFSILVQAQKQALNDTFIAEETAAGIDLGPEVFWISQTQPTAGSWPPRPSQDPRIDSGLRRVDLPDDVAGRRAVALWRSRQSQLAAFTDKLMDARDAHPLAGIEPLCVLAFGAAPAGGWVAHLQQLQAALDGPSPGSAQQEITNKLHIALDDFPRLVSLATRAAPGSTGAALAPSEWDEVFATLIAAGKVGQMFPSWLTEEHYLGFDREYWWAQKAQLPLWRASSNDRAAWQQALSDRSAPPIVDPQQLDVVDFIDPDVRDPAFALFAQRQQALTDLRTRMSAIVAAGATHLEGFDALLIAELFSEADTVDAAIAGTVQVLDADRAAFGQGAVTKLLEQVFGTPPPDFNALRQQLPYPVMHDRVLRTITETLFLVPSALDTIVQMQNNANPSPSDWQSFETVLAHAILIGSVVGQVQANEAGVDITPRLAQLGIDYDSFDRLVQLRRAAAFDTITDDEWNEVYGILDAVRRRRMTARWRDDEKVSEIVAGPDHFQTLDAPLTFPPPPPPEHDTWAFDQRARDIWDETLQSRIAAETSVIDAENAVVSGVEESRLPELRDLLITAGATTADAVTKRLQIDAAAGGCQMTTRVSQAMRTLQGFAFAIRNGDLSASLASAQIIDPSFDQKWDWIGSYATWRAAMLVFLFPENILVPTLRRRQSPAFADLVDASRAPGLSPEDACQAAKAYAQYFRDLFYLTPVASCQAKAPPPQTRCEDPQPPSDHSLVFTIAVTERRLYFTTYDPEQPNAQPDFWRRLPDIENFNEVLGAVPHQPFSGRRFIYLFFTTNTSDGKHPLAVLRYDLEAGTWEQQPTPLDLPPIKIGPVVVKQAASETPWPHVAVQDAATGEIWHQFLDGDKLTWGADWAPLYAPPDVAPVNNDDFAIYYPKGTLKALVEDKAEEFWLLIGDDKNTWAHRLTTSDLPIFRLVPTTNPTRTYFMTPNPVERDNATSQYGFAYQCTVFWLNGRQPSAEFSTFDRYYDQDDNGKPNWRFGNVGSTGYAGYTYQGTYGYYETTGAPSGFKGYDQLLTAQLPRPNESFIPFVFFTTNPKEQQDFLSRFGGSGWVAGGQTGYVRSGQWVALQGAYRYARCAKPGLSYFLNTAGGIYQLSETPTQVTGTIWLSPIVPHSGAPTATVTPTKIWFCGQATDAHGVRQPSSILSSLTIDGSGNLNGADWIGESFFFRPPTSGVDPFRLNPGLTSPELQVRRNDELTIVGNDSSPWLVEYAKEAYFFLPIQLALSLQASGQAQAALDWLRVVYDWSADGENRKIYFGLIQEEHALDFSRPVDWLLDPLNPHEIAQGRGWAYTSFTVQTIVKQFLADADAEFTRDTAESLERARILYQQAIDLLASNDLAANNGCYVLVVDIVAPERQFASAIALVRACLAALGSRVTVTAAAGAVRAALAAPNQPAAARVAAALAITNDWAPAPKSTVAQKLVGRQALRDSARSLLSDFAVADDLRHIVDGGSTPLGLTQWVPSELDFCIPIDPILQSLLLHAQLSLYKLRSCRNIAGLKRELDPYSAPIDASTGLPSIGAAGQLVLPGVATLAPTQYRYATLIERAKQLQQLANQTEASMLAAFEKRDAEAYAALRAQQDLATARAQVQVQTLKIGEAQAQARVAELQVTRAQLQSDQYNSLIQGGLSGLEIAAMATHAASAAIYAAGAIYSFIQGGPSGIGGGLADSAQAVSVTAGILDTQASFERRAQQWQDAKALADQDVLIGNQQVAAANIGVLVATQEQNVANIQADHAQATVQFLANKFTNVELYDFMATEYQRIYSFFLREATATAQLAQNQLAFERQQVPPPFIQPDYWRSPSDTSSTSSGSDSTDRRGLTGSARLLQDIYQLDLYAQQTNQRKLQLTRTLSLATLFPIEFGLFQASGALPFSTTLELFDRDFPGHYARLIRRVRISLIALVPTTVGIRATLSSTGTSRVVVAGEPFSTAVVVREPQSASYTSPVDATGVFELDPQADLLLPFEGLGVASDWRFELPRASNPIDFSTIADILITFEYTALDSYDYRQQVIRALSPFVDADRPFSFVNDLADAWWDLNNPDQIATPMSIAFRTERSDFPPNVDELSVAHVAVFVVRAEGEEFEVPLTLRFRADGAGGLVGGSAVTVDGLASTRSANGSGWLAIGGKPPVGEWQLTFPNTGEIRNRFAQEEIEDILFVITFSGRTPRWPT